ncbi:dihydrolipoamide acetyltransferase family protein [Pseudogracilibacillus auburnensis]|uniref:dihydrolipoamide acetyltransferase family protein n=1 Tax=Pseudogracilibacillus auburnensis TaxID=1494959 RepID=UPI001A95A2CF|nr:dihydrolipoamide acetyltransferase family protein [Pseudogracilibacillus auburnensis]MBO1005463.1 2-oxo acid dehydrogenase subunit E2 [Pseudogracilibacillus auburnensis]
MAEILLPRIDKDYEESSIIFWHKQEGDVVQKGDVLVEVQTEKAVSELEAEEEGILEKIIVKRGEVATVGDVLGIIAAEGAETSSKEISESAVAAIIAKEPAERSFVRVPPRLRKLAKDLKIDLTKVQGSGNGGKITEKDIRHFAELGGSDPGEKLAGIRKTIATRMKESLQNSAQLTETAYADVTKLAIKRDSKKKMSWNSWILYAVIRAIKEHLYMNGTYENEVWKQSEEVHLGVATDTEEGLFVPVVENAGQYLLAELDEVVSELVRSVHDKNINPKHLSGSTFTVTNLGAFGIHFFTPIINPPEVAILGLGKIESHLVLEDGQVTEKKRLPLSLTFDHQMIDGAPAARFLQTLIAYLENPEKLE